MAKKKIIKETVSQTDFWEDAKSYIDIRNCSFGFKCNQKWEDLIKRKEKNIKYCPQGSIDSKIQDYVCSKD